MFSQILKVVIVFTLFFTSIDAVIQIDIEPSELQSIGEVLVESYFHHNLIQREPSLRNTILTKIQNVSITVLQLIGVTASLVAANVLTPMLQTKIEPTTTTIVEKTYQNSNITLIPSKMCPHDFGCDQNVCWRSCDTGVKGDNGKSWCYTTSNHQLKKYHQCIKPHDCSPCWECLGVCHTAEH